MDDRNTHASTHPAFILRALTAAFFLVCLGSAGRAQGSQELVRTPLERDGAGMLIVKAKLGSQKQKVKDQEFRFVLDTGASRSVVDLTVPSAFFVDTEAPAQVRDSTERAVTLKRVTLARLDIGAQAREKLTVYRMDLKNGILARYQDEPVDGILGMDVLRGRRFVIDPQKGEIRWGEGLEGSRVPLAYDSYGRPTLAVKLNGAEMCSYLDTGARSAFRLLGEVQPGQASTSFFFRGLGGQAREGKRIVVELLGVGDQAWRQAPLELAPPGEAGNHLGRASLCAAPLELNLAENWAVFTPGPDGSLPWLPFPDRPELVWDASLGRRSLRVDSCPTRWARIGLKPADEVIQVGPLKGKALTLCNLWAFLQQGEAHTWVVQREGVLIPLNSPAEPAGGHP